MKGEVVRIERTFDGKLNDGPNGEPAIQEYAGSNVLISQERFKDGERNDSLYGEAALKRFDE